MCRCRRSAFLVTCHIFLLSIFAGLSKHLAVCYIWVCLLISLLCLLNIVGQCGQKARMSWWHNLDRNNKVVLLCLLRIATSIFMLCMRRIKHKNIIWWWTAVWVESSNYRRERNWVCLFIVCRGFLGLSPCLKPVLKARVQTICTLWSRHVALTFCHPCLCIASAYIRTLFGWLMVKVRSMVQLCWVGWDHCRFKIVDLAAQFLSSKCLGR